MRRIRVPPHLVRSGSFRDSPADHSGQQSSHWKGRIQPVQSSVGELAAALVAIDSVNPALVPGGAGEREIASFVADWCVANGFEVEVLGDERPSVVARKRGSGGGRSLLLNGHLDTVGVAGMEAPFEPRVEGDRLYGRGAYDMKGALAAILARREQCDGVARRCDRNAGRRRRARLDRHRGGSRVRACRRCDRRRANRAARGNRASRLRRL